MFFTDSQYKTNNNPNVFHTSQNQVDPAYYPRRPYDPNGEPMTLKEWLITFLLLMIPVANIILPFVWAFSDRVNKSKKTFFQAYLIFMLIGAAVAIILTILLIGYITAAVNNSLSDLEIYY